MSLATDHWFSEDPNYTRVGDNWEKVNSTDTSDNCNSNKLDEEKLEKLVSDLGFGTVEFFKDMSEFEFVDTLKNRMKSLEEELFKKELQLKEFRDRETKCYIENADDIDDDFSNVSLETDILSISRILQKLYKKDELNSHMKFLIELWCWCFAKDVCIDRNMITMLQKYLFEENCSDE